jgi:hypothetical protein
VVGCHFSRNETFFAIIFLMGHTRRDNLKEYWSTDPFLEITIFGKLMSPKRFEQIWWCSAFQIGRAHV